jgi:hypothetical protein
MTTAHKKGGVDLSAFHATQGRRIVDVSITLPLQAGSPTLKKDVRFFGPAGQFPAPNHKYRPGQNLLS